MKVDSNSPDNVSEIASEAHSRIRIGPANAIPEELFVELCAVASDEGCELLHVGRNGPSLQLVIDHQDGVTHSLCGSISRQAGALLDGLNYSNGRYILEVSSPGLDREFYSLQDYSEFLGKKVKVVHRTGGAKATIRGELEEVDPARLKIRVFNEDANRSEQIALQDVQTTRLHIDV